MYYMKVIFHQVLFGLFSGCIFFYSDHHVIVKVLALLQAYIGSYFVSMWTIKLMFKLLSLKVCSENKCVLITGKMLLSLC